jgi:hypothetical protein
MAGCRWHQPALARATINAVRVDRKSQAQNWNAAELRALLVDELVGAVIGGDADLARDLAALVKRCDARIARAAERDVAPTLVRRQQLAATRDRAKSST